MYGESVFLSKLLKTCNRAIKTNLYLWDKFDDESKKKLLVRQKKNYSSYSTPLPFPPFSTGFSSWASLIIFLDMMAPRPMTIFLQKIAIFI